MTALCPHCGQALAAAPAPRIGGLTRQQQALLDFIVLQIRETGLAPNYSEMRAGMGLASNSGVARLLDGLEERGRIRRLANRVRAIELVGQGS